MTKALESILGMDLLSRYCVQWDWDDGMMLLSNTDYLEGQTLIAAQDPTNMYGPGARVKSLAVPEAECLPEKSERARLLTRSHFFPVSLDNLNQMVMKWII